MINRLTAGIFGLPRRDGCPRGGSGAHTSRQEAGKICPMSSAGHRTVEQRLPSRKKSRSIPWSVS